MKSITRFSHAIREIMTQWIPMPDGTRLAARIWLPVDAETNPVPAVLEYLPYRRRDGTSYRDSVAQPYLAGHGYAAVRVDIRGTGDSEGLMLDEYDLPEQHDGVEVIAWLARQSWCSGNVGMWGLSWGGFNALQVAALNPPALKAIMPMGFTHDRYNGDCHYMGGCMIEGNTSWGGTLFAGSSRPPDPAVVGERWREMWLERLNNATMPIEIWLRHQRRDAYWKPGSVCEDYTRITAAVYAVSGWQDSYSRNVFPLIEHLRSPKKALVGPWAHGWPHMARPGPAIGFMQEAVRWWDHWLKGTDTGIMDEPMLRMWMGEWVKPAKLVESWPGRWVGEPHWPAPGIAATTFMLNTEGLREHAAPQGELTIRSPQTTGLRAGYQCSYGLGPDLSDDQRIDDAQSLCFDTLPLVDRLEIAGEPELELDIRSDQPQALIAVRLCDVAPDGASLRVTYGLLNLSHRDCEEFPTSLVPGQTYRVKIRLCGIAYAFPAGHRIRVALSTAYWPIAWPSPATTTLSLATGTGLLRLPTRNPTPAVDDALAPFQEPEGAAPMAMVETRPRETASSQDRIEEHLGEGRVDLVRTRDRGAWRMTDTDVAYDATGELRFSIQADDPLSALQQMQLTTTMGREGWNVRTEVQTKVIATAEAFLLHAKLDAWDGDKAVFSRTWDLQVPRDNV
jgi:putative CocE/NonD family hydrolase